MSEHIELPWLDEPVELSEAIELVAYATENDEVEMRELRSRVGRLERRIGGLEDGSTVSCPACGKDDNVYTAGVGAAVLANDGALSETNAEALNGESHVCLDCKKSFTPQYE